MGVLVLAGGGVPSVVEVVEDVPVVAGGVAELPCAPPLVAPSPVAPAPVVGGAAVLPCWEVGPTEPDEQAAIAAKAIVPASTLAAE
jgi:hypothetical protein